MRIGFNPAKDELLERDDYSHQIIIPVYIPNFENYYKDSLRILKASLESLFASIHDNTFVSIVNNGSCQEVQDFLDNLLTQGFINELVHTENIGKLNAILKAISGHNMPIITIADSDVYFCQNWQEETYKIFNTFPKAATVGLVPQFNMFSNHCTNTIFDNFFNKNFKFYRVEEPEGMWKFYKSIGWNISKEHYYFHSILGINSNGTKACVGAGHFVATYRKELFENIARYLPYRLGGTSEKYLDAAAMKKGYWKLTTFENHAYHMGNVWEDWMETLPKAEKINVDLNSWHVQKKESLLGYLLKNKIFKYFLRINKVNRWFFLYKKLPKSVLKKYPKIYY